jgi:hypothetical protein
MSVYIPPNYRKIRNLALAKERWDGLPHCGGQPIIRARQCLGRGDARRDPGQTSRGVCLRIGSAALWFALRQQLGVALAFLRANSASASGAGSSSPLGARAALFFSFEVT